MSYEERELNLKVKAIARRLRSAGEVIKSTAGCEGDPIGNGRFIDNARQPDPVKVTEREVAIEDAGNALIDAAEIGLLGWIEGLAIVAAWVRGPENRPYPFSKPPAPKTYREVYFAAESETWHEKSPALVWRYVRNALWEDHEKLLDVDKRYEKHRDKPGWRGARQNEDARAWGALCHILADHVEEEAKGKWETTTSTAGGVDSLTSDGTHEGARADNRASVAPPDKQARMAPEHSQSPPSPLDVIEERCATSTFEEARDRFAGLCELVATWVTEGSRGEEYTKLAEHAFELRLLSHRLGARFEPMSFAATQLSRDPKSTDQTMSAIWFKPDSVDPLRVPLYTHVFGQPEGRFVHYEISPDHKQAIRHRMKLWSDWARACTARSFRAMEQIDELEKLFYGNICRIISGWRRSDDGANVLTDSMAGSTKAPSEPAAAADPLASNGGVIESEATRPGEGIAEELSPVPSQPLKQAQLAGRVKDAYDLLRKEGPLQAKEIANKMGVGISTVTTRYIPPLKELGLIDNNADGYFVVGE